ACREDNLYRLYLNRNITITPQNEPSSGNVTLRLYLKKEELDSLETAVNTLGESSGVYSVNELGVFKNEDACSIAGGNIAPVLGATPAAYNSDYYLQTSVSSFSSFYFASNLLTTLLPVTISSFTGKSAGEDNLLNWQANGERQVIFGIERSLDGINFINIGNLNAAAADYPGTYSFTDHHPSASAQYDYYRLGITEDGKLVSYSTIIVIARNKNQGVQIAIYPTIVRISTITVHVSSINSQSIEFSIYDNVGRIVFRHPVNVGAGLNQVFLYPGSLSPGTYWVYGIGMDGRTNVTSFIRE
ncbi:MAG TPA: hypothetical protein VIH86_05475, partial [Puia sp.]